MELKDEFNFPTFYEGQRVVVVDGLPNSNFKNGDEYTVSSYEYKMNPVNGLWFWYIGIIGIHQWLRPSIFAPIIPPMQNITFEKLSEENPISVN